MLTQVLEAYRDCGMWGYADTLLGALGLALGVLAVALAVQETPPGSEARKRLAVAALAVGGLVLLGGVGAYFMGIQQTLRALAAVDPSMKARIEELGRHEAQSCIWIGVGLWVPITLLGAAALGGAAITASGKTE